MSLSRSCKLLPFRRANQFTRLGAPYLGEPVIPFLVIRTRLPNPGNPRWGPVGSTAAPLRAYGFHGWPFTPLTRWCKILACNWSGPLCLPLS